VLPFMGLELFVGFIQAFVFAILTLVFMSLATESHAAHGEPGGAAHH
jgi:F-type H+-transporting ATPase subunit a